MRKRENQRNKIVVYTAIMGEYEPLRKPSYVSKNVDYLCFTDNKKLTSKFWTPVVIEESPLDPTRKARQLKIKGHPMLEKYDYTVWIDGNMDLIGDVTALIARHFLATEKREPKSAASLMVCFKHPSRDCVYEEAEACIRYQRDSAEAIRKQAAKYKSAGYPNHHGMIESNVLIRKNKSPKLKRVMEDWWQEVVTESRRDQMSFNYVAWKHDFHYQVMSGHSHGKSAYFQIRYNHRKEQSE